MADANNNRTRKINTAGIITTVAGNGSLGDGGPATSAALLFPQAVAADGTGNLYIADSNNTVVRRVDASTGIITTFAGVDDFFGFNGDGIPASSARLSGPNAVAVDGTGDVFIADAFNNRIRRVDAVSGIITTVAGNGAAGFNGDGASATSATLSFPTGVAVDALGNLFIADQNNNRIRRVDAVSGIITTVAGNGTPGFSGDGGPATSAALNLSSPFSGTIGITVDGAGNIFFTDVSNSRVRRVDAITGAITTVAGSSISCNGGALGDGGPATAASMCFPEGVVVDPTGVLYISDSIDRLIRRVDAKTGIMTTIAGGSFVGFSGDGGLSTAARFEFLRNIALFGANTLFVADANSNRIRRIQLAPPAPPTSSSDFITDPATTKPVATGELVIHKELSGFPNYGAADGAADLLFTGQAATWNFPLGAMTANNTPGLSCAHFQVSVIADDHTDVPSSSYQLLAWVNGNFDTGFPPVLVHGAPAGSRFNNWIRQNYATSSATSPLTFTLSNSSSGTGPADFIAVDWVELHIPLSCNDPSSAVKVVSAEFRTPNFFFGVTPPTFSGPEPGATAIDSVFSAADIWNDLTIPAFPALQTNPTFIQLRDNTGAQTPVSFSITGTVVGVDLFAPAGAVTGFLNPDPLRANYLAFNSNSDTNPGESTTIQWQIAGLAPNTPYDMCIYGARADVARSFNMRIGRINLTIPTLLFNDPSPSSCVLFPSIVSDANGAISGTGTGFGSTVGFQNEANWSGFQIAAATGPVPPAVLNITPPPSVRLDALESDLSAFFFAERVSFVLPSAITVDASSPGTYNSVGSLTPGMVPAGTVVDSYFLHADPFDPNNGVLYSGSMTFTNPILGVLALSASLDQTDAILGAPATLYPIPGSEGARGFELGGPEMFVISPDRMTLTFSNVASGATDELRIVTAASPPQPVAPGTSTTFTNPNVINQTVTIPPDANMNGTATMRVSFIQVSPAVFNAGIANGTNGNTFSGGTPVPAGTTCTPIIGANGNCIITENKCFDATGAAFPLCPITSTTTPILLTSQFKTPTPQTNPALLIATDGQTNYAVITSGFDPSDPTITGGTKGLNSDEVIANLPGTPPSDTVPPTTAAVTSPIAPNGANGWFTTSPVTVILAASDDTLVGHITYSASGAQPIAPTTVAGASALFFVANQGVTSISYQATDQAGNVEALKTLTVKIDTTAPSITITSPTNAGNYLLNQVVAASYSCKDPISNTAPSCVGPVPTGTNIDTASVGGKVFTVNSTDVAGLSAMQSVSYSVDYNVCLLYDPTHGVKSGATIPLKMYLCDAKGNDVSNTGVIVHATKLIQVSTQASDTIVSAGTANPDNDFRFDSTLGPRGGYIFNLKANLATGTYNLFFAAGNDPSTTHFLMFQVN